MAAIEGTFAAPGSSAVLTEWNPVKVLLKFASTGSVDVEARPSGSTDWKVTATITNASANKSLVCGWEGQTAIEWRLTCTAAAGNIGYSLFP